MFSVQCTRVLSDMCGLFAGWFLNSIISNGSEIAKSSGIVPTPRNYKNEQLHTLINCSSQSLAMSQTTSSLGKLDRDLILNITESNQQCLFWKMKHTTQWFMASGINYGLIFISVINFSAKSGIARKQRAIEIVLSFFQVLKDF